MTNFMNAVKSTKTEKSPAKKKSDMPEINPNKDIKKAVDDLVTAKEDMAEIKAEIAILEPKIIETVCKIQETDALVGNFHKSYKVLGVKQDIKFISANKFSIAEEDIEDLNKLFGKNFDKLITTSYVVKLKDEIFTDKAKQKKLMELLGDEFNTFFETITNRKVCENFDKKLFDLDADTRENVKVLAKQAKPSLR